MNGLEQVALVAADARRMARRGSVADSQELSTKCAALTALTAGDSPQTLRACLYTDDGAALAREIILLDDGASAAAGRVPQPEQASGTKKSKAKKGKPRPEPEAQGALEIQLGGECDGDVCTVGITEGVAFCIADFGACRASLPNQVLVQTTPPLADGDLTNSEELRGHIAVCTRGGVPFIEKARRAQESGAVALIVVNAGGENELEPDLLFEMGSAVDGDEPMTIPVIGVGAADGKRLLSAGVPSPAHDDLIS